MTDHTKLRELAQAATPGRWMRLFGERTVYDRMEDGCRGNAIVRADDSPPRKQDAANLDYIAAANPAAVLSLLDTIDVLRAENEAMRANDRRYRWLRDVAHPDSEGPAVTKQAWNSWGELRPGHLTSGLLDAAIDAAQEQQT